MVGVCGLILNQVFLRATTMTIESGVDRRVLSIQSHVVHGYVGNNCAVFPMQLHGFDVDAINSVQFSNHTWYSHTRGQILDSIQLGELYDGLRLNDIHHYSHILTGYCANETFLHKIVEIVRDQRALNRNLLYFCDPVLGDNGRYYVPENLMHIYRDEVIPIADVVTPNQFELSKLTGIDISTETDCLAAIAKLHSMGIKKVVVTSSDISADASIMYCYGSAAKSDGTFDQYRFNVPRIDAHFVGTGDVFTSLLLIWLHIYHDNIEKAVSNVLSSIQSVLRRTLHHAMGTINNLIINTCLISAKNVSDTKPSCNQLELRLIQSRDELLAPNLSITSTKL